MLLPPTVNTTVMYRVDYSIKGTYKWKGLESYSTLESARERATYVSTFLNYNTRIVLVVTNTIETIVIEDKSETS